MVFISDMGLPLLARHVGTMFVWQSTKLQPLYPVSTTLCTSFEAHEVMNRDCGRFFQRTNVFGCFWGPPWRKKMSSLTAVGWLTTLVGSLQAL